MKKEDTDINLQINIENFENSKEQAKKLFEEEYPSDDSNTYLFEDLSLDYCEQSVENNQIKLSGGLVDKNGVDLGFISFEVPLDLDNLIDLFQGYIKKLQKVKNVMESVKGE